jgi:hypothetical protein
VTELSDHDRTREKRGEQMALEASMQERRPLYYIYCVMLVLTTKTLM